MEIHYNKVWEKGVKRLNPSTLVKTCSKGLSVMAHACNPSHLGGLRKLCESQNIIFSSINCNSSNNSSNISKKSLPNQISLIFFSIFFWKLYIFRFYIHVSKLFELMYLDSWGYHLKFFFLFFCVCLWIANSSMTFLENATFSPINSFYFIKCQLFIYVWIYFWILYSIPLIYLSTFFPIPHYFLISVAWNNSWNQYTTWKEF